MWVEDKVEDKAESIEAAGRIGCVDRQEDWVSDRFRREKAEAEQGQLVQAEKLKLLGDLQQAPKASIGGYREGRLTVVVQMGVLAFNGESRVSIG